MKMEPPQSKYPDLSSMESRVKRYKAIGRILVISNVALGAYMFSKARNRGAKKDVEDNKVSEEVSLDSTTLSVPETPSPAPAVQ